MTPLGAETSPELVVQRQLDAYNARQLDAWLDTYHADAEQFLLHGGLLACGREAMRKRMVDRFDDVRLHAKLLSRTVLDSVVVDHELVTRTMPTGLAEIEMICLYEVKEGLIAKATFAMAQPRQKA
jgi:hypothetical protein